MAQLADIEHAIKDGTLNTKSRAILEEYSRVHLTETQNPAFHLRFEQAQIQVGRALARLDAIEAATKAEQRHLEIRGRLEELKKPHWTVLPNFGFTVIGAIAAVAAAVLTWIALRK